MPKYLALSIIIILFIAGIICLKKLFFYTQKKNFMPGSRKYPGVKSNEVFLKNISTELIVEEDGSLTTSIRDLHALEKNFADISYATKRLGEEAYTENAFILKNHKPVFIQQREWDKER
mgnify:CR=1 FL=1